MPLQRLRIRLIGVYTGTVCVAAETDWVDGRARVEGVRFSWSDFDGSTRASGRVGDVAGVEGAGWFLDTRPPDWRRPVFFARAGDAPGLRAVVAPLLRLA